MSFQDLEAGRPLNSRRGGFGSTNGFRQQDPTQAIASGIFQINTAVSTFQRLVNTLGTRKDTPELRDKLHKTRLHIGQLVKDTSDKLKQASETDHRAEVSASKKVTDAKLAKDFQAVLKEFQKAQRLSAERETAYIPFVAQADHPKSYAANETDKSSERGPEQRAFPVESRRQEVLLLENEIAFNEAIIEEREQGIQEIQNQIGEVNEIFKDLAVLVHEQGAMIAMIPWEMGRGRGRSSSHRGRGAGRVILQMGNKKLIAFDSVSMNASTSSNIVDEKTLKEFLAFKASQGHNPEEVASYAKTLINENEDEGWVHTPNKEVILLLDHKDQKWKDQPWLIVERYLDTGYYPNEAYKSRLYYEEILKAESCEITHYTGNNKAYSFSKIIIKQIISVETWGTSPLRDWEILHPETKTPIKYNYWDYVKAFQRVFLYENPSHKHSWFIKVCHTNYESEIPIWFYQWWQSYGPSIDIFINESKKFKTLYHQWVELSPALIEAQHDNTYIEGMASLHYFVQFSIPWIWKWMPETGYTSENIFCLKRTYMTKFWKKMMDKDEDGKIKCQDTLDQIQKTIELYQQQQQRKQQRESPSPFQHIVGKIKMIKGTDNISDEELMQYYLAEVKKDIAKNFKKNDESSKMSGSSSSQMEEEDS